MRKIGVDKLRRHTGEVLRRLQEDRETVAITHRGRVIARLAPVERPEERRGEALRVWADMDELAQEIGACLRAAGGGSKAHLGVVQEQESL